jgi:cytoskeletal protein RodZ
LEAFGEKLRRQREQRGITLEAISSTTKISTRMLRALEEEHFDQLPGGVFNKGFIRAYARQVGLDEEEAITDYLAALHSSQLQSQQILPDLRAGNSHRRTSQPLHHLHEPARPDDPNNDEADEKHGPHDAGAAVIAADADSAAADRRHRVRRAQDRKKKKEDGRTEDRRTEDHNDEDSKPPWQIENRPAADLLRAAHEKEDEDSARRPGMRIFATGTFGEVNSEKSSNRVPWGTLAAVLLVLCAGLAFWNARRHNRSAQLSEAASPAAAAPSNTSTPPTAEPPLSRSSSTLHSLKTKLETPAATKPSKPSAAKSEPLSTHSSSANESAPHPAASESTQDNPAAPFSISPAPISKAVSRSTAATNPVPFTLLIRAEKTSWVSITADGKLVAEETLIAPAEKSVRANDEIVIKAGNAAGVSFLLNAKEIPAEGKDGEVRTYTFDASGMKASGSSQLSKTD